MKVWSRASAWITLTAFFTVTVGAGLFSASTAHPLTTQASKGGTATTTTVPLPIGVIPARQVCEDFTGHRSSGFFTEIKQVRLVLTTYARGLAVESGAINPERPPDDLVWVVEVHAKSINWNHSVPNGYKPPKLPADDYSVVMNARTGVSTDRGECRCWPLPLQQLGQIVSFSPTC
jgi:hypothetical protein